MSRKQEKAKINIDAFIESAPPSGRVVGAPVGAEVGGNWLTSGGISPLRPASIDVEFTHISSIATVPSPISSIELVIVFHFFPLQKKLNFKL